TAKKNLDTVLLLNMNTDNFVSTQTNSDAENFVFVESSSTSEKTIQNNQKTQESSDFIGEIGRVFSTLGSLFGFLN
ncbi:MAG: tetratricopeptide repeat protein, partial [Nitrosopumilus sp.]|nr:tetratricopeptide repeat protein [Nitrosopumilus sp.]